MLLASIDTNYLEHFSLDFCFLKTNHKTDHILERFSTNWLFPRIHSLTIRFFEHLRQDWCDHNSNKLKYYLLGIFKTNNIRTIKLINLDNNLFYSINVFLNDVSESLTNKLISRKLSYYFNKESLTTDFVISLE